MNTGRRWSPCRNAQMAMSGTLTASTAGVSVPGGATHRQEPGKGLQPPAPRAAAGGQWPVLCPALFCPGQLWFFGGQLS